MHAEPDRETGKGAWRLVIPQVPKSGNLLLRMHWARYHQILQSWYYLLRGADGFLDVTRPQGKRYVTIVRHGIRKLDRDNLYSSMKPVVDVLRQPRHESGVYKGGLKAGQAWSRERIGHGLILEDDEEHLRLEVKNASLLKGQKPYLEVFISDLPISEG